METYLTRVTDYLLTQSWQIALLVVVIAAVSLALRNKSAHVRYLLWLIVLAKCLAPPLLTVPLAILPQEKPAMPFEVVGTTISEPLELPSEPVKLTPAPIVRERPTKLTIRQWLGAGWMLGAITFLIFNLLKALRANYWLWRKRMAVSAELLSDIENLFSVHGIKNFPGVWQIDGISQPFVWGLLRGSIYLPTDLLSLKNSKRCRNLLGHEFNHVIRFDAAVNFLQVIVQAIFWFHPFVWWANRKIRAEREKCCDEMVIARLNTSPRDYSTAIVETLVAKYESTRPVPSLAVAGPVKNIEERIKTMLRPGKKFYKRPSLVTVTVVLLLALLTVPTALVLTAEAQEKSTAAPPPAPTAKDKAAATAALFRAMKATDYRARKAEDITSVRSAIAQGADLDAKNNNGRTPLHVAVRQKRYEMIRLLLEAGANPNAQDPRGEIPLHFTARHWGISNAGLLVSAGSNVNARDRKGMRPAMIAFELGNTDMFDLMVTNGATVPNDLMAAYKGNLTRVQSLIANGKAQETFEQGLTLLHAAAAGGHTAIVELLLANGLDVRSETQAGYTALHHAAEGNHREVAELLLAKGADINAEPGKQTPLHWAIRKHHKDMIDWLVARGANPNADGGGWATPLHWAIWCWDVDTAVLLVSHGGDIHLETQEYPDSPLYDAVWNSNRTMTEALVTKAGDARAAKYAPLHTTVVRGDIQAIEDLLAKGTDVNARDEDGYTALFIAALRGHKEVVELLLAKGADINARLDVDAKGAGGWTSLHAASRHDRKSVAQLLIAKGADVNAKTEKGQTALSLAKENGHTEIVELLRKHGAKE